MKKLLLATTAFVGVVMMSAPASAGLKMDLGGYFRGYGIYNDNNRAEGVNAHFRKYDVRRDSEIHFNGETTLDNGLTVGAHSELKTMNTAAANAIDESYLYFSGGWGRINFGAADGAAYLLQVNAPSADSNIDGMRMYIAGLDNNGVMGASAVVGAGGQADNAAAWNFNPALDYQHADFRQQERLTYMTPKFNGFQAGVSYAPSSGGMEPVGGNLLVPSLRDASLTAFNNLWEASARWDGEYQGFGLALGGGYSSSQLERDPTTAEVTALAAQHYFFNDGITTWNGGANVTFSGFSLGGVYKNSSTKRITNADKGVTNVARTGDVTRDTWVGGLGYNNGPWHAGASYLHQTTKYDAVGAAALASDILATQQTNTKYTVGGGMTFAPGMTFRGAVAWGKFDAPAGVAFADNRFQQVTIGTDVKF